MLAGRLRAAGCVFAEDEARALVRDVPDADRRDGLVRRRERGEPLEQLLGVVEFGALRLAVGPGVFVPRQRSLLLARLALRHTRAHPAPVLLEACAGVAPIASTVARRSPKAVRAGAVRGAPHRALPGRALRVRVYVARPERRYSAIDPGKP